MPTDLETVELPGEAWDVVLHVLEEELDQLEPDGEWLGEYPAEDGVEAIEEVCEEIVESRGEGGAVRQERPKVLAGATQRISTGYGKVYVSINVDDGEPFEVFLTTGESGGYTNAWAEALAKTISNALRSGTDPEVIADDLMGIRTDKKEIDNGDLVHSIPDAVGVALMRHVEGKEGGPQTDPEPVRGLPPGMAGEGDEVVDEEESQWSWEPGPEGDMP